VNESTVDSEIHAANQPFDFPHEGHQLELAIGEAVLGVVRTWSDADLHIEDLQSSLQPFVAEVMATTTMAISVLLDFQVSCHLTLERVCKKQAARAERRGRVSEAKPLPTNALETSLMAWGVAYFASRFSEFSQSGDGETAPSLSHIREETERCLVGIVDQVESLAITAACTWLICQKYA